MNTQVVLSNETLLNIFSNFIPTKIKIFTNSDPPRMSVDIKSNMQLKKKFYRLYIRHQR